MKNIILPHAQLRHYVVFIFILMLTGCGHKPPRYDLSYTLPILRLSTPEVSGKLFTRSAKIHSGVNPSRRFGAIGGGSSTITDNSVRESAYYIYLGGELSLGLVQYVDVYTRALVGSPYIIGAKIQIYGDSQRLKTRGLKAAISTEYGYLNETNSSNRNHYLNVTSYDVSLNIGYRFNPRWVIYFNNFYTHESLTGALGYPSSSLEFSFKEISKGFGRTIGARYHFNKVASKKIREYITFEIGGSNINWPNNLEYNNAKYEWTNVNKPEGGEPILGIGYGFLWD